MSQVGEIQGGEQARFSPAELPRDIPVWTAILAGGVVLGAVGAALVIAENERAHTIRGFLQNLRYERD